MHLTISLRFDVQFLVYIQAGQAEHPSRQQQNTVIFAQDIYFVIDCARAAGNESAFESMLFKSVQRYLSFLEVYTMLIGFIFKGTIDDIAVGD